MPQIIFRPAPTPPPFVPPVPVDGPLTFTAREADSSVSFRISGSVPNVSLSYSTDNGETWNPFSFSQTINLAAVGDSVMFKGDNNSFSVDNDNFISIRMSGKIEASGSLAFLLDSNGLLKALNPYCFKSLFTSCDSLVQAPALPATSLAVNCYESMFYGCTSLVQAPALPATSLAVSCYNSMFYGCTSLVQAPDLPASTLAEYCYFEMFSNCLALVQAPALPATTLAENCYSSMFKGCTSLVQAPTLSATMLAAHCYFSMFQNCPSLNYVECNATDISADECVQSWLSYVSSNGTFKKNPSMNDWPSGESGIPDGWTVENI